jgi:hypothetical protein
VAIFVSILIEGLDTPELDFEASEGTIENEPQSENHVTEPESTLTKGKFQPFQADLAEAVHNILTEFIQAAEVAKLRVEHRALKEAVCARVRRDRPEWSEYDLEAAYDHLHEKDAEINAMVASVCASSSRVRNEKSSAERQ